MFCNTIADLGQKFCCRAGRFCRDEWKQHIRGLVPVLILTKTTAFIMNRSWEVGSQLGVGFAREFRSLKGKFPNRRHETGSSFLHVGSKFSSSVIDTCTIKDLFIDLRNTNSCSHLSQKPPLVSVCQVTKRHRPKRGCAPSLCNTPFAGQHIA
jgi:hypothetical protein